MVECSERSGTGDRTMSRLLRISGIFSIDNVAMQYAPEPNSLAPQNQPRWKVGRGRGIGEAASQLVDTAFIDHNGDIGR